jgi:hypothetical protein
LIFFVLARLLAVVPVQETDKICHIAQQIDAKDLKTGPVFAEIEVCPLTAENDIIMNLLPK